MTQIEAIEEIMHAWGLDNQTRLDAIRLVIRGVDIGHVLATVNEIQNAMGGLEALKY